MASTPLKKNVIQVGFVSPKFKENEATKYPLVRKMKQQKLWNHHRGLTNPNNALLMGNPSNLMIPAPPREKKWHHKNVGLFGFLIFAIANANLCLQDSNMNFRSQRTETKRLGRGFRVETWWLEFAWNLLKVLGKGCKHMLWNGGGKMVIYHATK